MSWKHHLIEHDTRKIVLGRIVRDSKMQWTFLQHELRKREISGHLQNSDDTTVQYFSMTLAKTAKMSCTNNRFEQPNRTVFLTLPLICMESNLASEAKRPLSELVLLST